jgi:hypothetical protein
VYGTAGHCSEFLGSNNFTEYHQPWPYGNEVAMEYEDPPFFYNWDEQDCPIKELCRWSDFLIAKYNAGVEAEVGLIARTYYAGRSSGSLVIRNWPSHFYVRGVHWGSPALGTRLEKMGQVTGWTYGWVVDACDDVKRPNDGPLMLCQDWVDAGADRGDSGAPVFRWYWNGQLYGDDVTLYGVLWGKDGGDYVFSSMSNIVMDVEGQFERFTYVGDPASRSAGYYARRAHVCTPWGVLYMVGSSEYRRTAVLAPVV